MKSGKIGPEMLKWHFGLGTAHLRISGLRSSVNHSDSSGSFTKKSALKRGEAKTLSMPSCLFYWACSVTINALPEIVRVPKTSKLMWTPWKMKNNIPGLSQFTYDDWQYNEIEILRTYLTVDFNVKGDDSPIIHFVFRTESASTCPQLRTYVRTYVCIYVRSKKNTRKCQLRANQQPQHQLNLAVQWTPSNLDL